MVKYLIRSVKYLVSLCVLCVALVWLMRSTNGVVLTPAEQLQIMFSTWRGWSLVATIIILSATYPYFGFVRRRFEGDITRDGEQIEAACRLAHLVIIARNDEEIVVRAEGLQRLVSLFEDEVHIRQCGSQIEVEGLRRIAVRLAFDIERYITNKQRNEA